MGKRIKIFDKIYVRGLGQCPMDSVIVSDWQYFNLKQLGLKMYILNEEINPGTIIEPVIDDDGKINKKLMPSISIIDTFILPTEAAMLSCAAEKGDICMRTDLKKNFILSESPATNVNNWKEFLSPIDVELKTMCFILSGEFDVGNNGTILQFPKDGILNNIDAFCSEPDSTGEVEFTVERISKENFELNGTWEDILVGNHIVFQPNEKNKEINTLNFTVNSDDYFRINIIKSNMKMQNLTVQMNIFHQ